MSDPVVIDWERVHTIPDESAEVSVSIHRNGRGHYSYSFWRVVTRGGEAKEYRYFLVTVRDGKLESFADRFPALARKAEQWILSDITRRLGK